MDLLELLRTKAASIPVGDHSRGLGAVLIHIEAAFGHLARGQKLREDTAYTDAIYRTNLAFEGGVKEAYRVLTQQDPSKKRPFDIEKYLEDGKVLRPRILAQFTTYRTDWRNPSAHDYTLDFDEGEALLAIVSVSAFVYVLLDEIAEKLAEDASRKAAEDRTIPTASGLENQNSDLLTEVIHALQIFHQVTHVEKLDSPAKLIGAIHGFLSVAIPNAVIHNEVGIARTSLRTDLMIKEKNSVVFVEVKNSPTAMTIRASLNQFYALAEGAKADGILFILSGVTEVSPHFIAHPRHRLVILSSLEQVAAIESNDGQSTVAAGTIFCQAETPRKRP